MEERKVEESVRLNGKIKEKKERTTEKREGNRKLEGRVGRKTHGRERKNDKKRKQMRKI